MRTPINLTPGSAIRLTWLTDPGHAWLAVPRSLLDQLDLADTISPFSYLHSAAPDLALCEEDCDATAVLWALQARGVTVTTTWVEAPWVRGCPRYPASPGWEDRARLLWPVMAAELRGELTREDARIGVVTTGNGEPLYLVSRGNEPLGSFHTFADAKRFAGGAA